MFKNLDFPNKQLHTKRGKCAGCQGKAGGFTLSNVQASTLTKMAHLEDDTTISVVSISRVSALFLMLGALVCAPSAELTSPPRLGSPEVGHDHVSQSSHLWPWNKVTLSHRTSSPSMRDIWLCAHPVLGQKQAPTLFAPAQGNQNTHAVSHMLVRPTLAQSRAGAWNFGDRGWRAEWSTFELKGMVMMTTL